MDGQYEALQEFRGECKSLGIVEAYESVADFRRKFGRQLAQMVLDVDREKGEETGGWSEQQDRERNLDVVEHAVGLLTRDAGELLVRCSLAGDGMIMSVKTFGGLAIQAGGRTFTDRGDPRSEARWEAALESLVDLGLVRDYGHKGELFRLTDVGYRVADRIGPSTTQRRAWMEINGGEDVRGSRVEDEAAREVIRRHKGVRVGSGYRFPDGSILVTRQGRIVASPDNGEG